jgi:hypothetical protein
VLAFGRGLGLRLTVALVFVMLLAGCARIPPRRYALDSIAFEGNTKISDSDLEDHIASHETPKFAGVFQGIL